MKKLLIFNWLIYFCWCCSFSLADSPDETLNIALISDINESYGSLNYSSQVFAAIDFIIKSRPDLVLCAGDIIAGQNLKLSEESLKAMWKAFDQLVRKPLLKNGIAIAFTFGNHDGSASKKFNHERKIALDYWLNRRPNLNFVDCLQFPKHYSFVCKGVFFAVIDASTPIITEQCKIWLKQQFASPKAKTARLRVVMGHLPLYAIAEGRNQSGDVLANADQLSAFFMQLGVDYYISGHHHAFYFSRKGRLKMIACGALGSVARRLIGSNQPPQKTFSMLRLGLGDKEFQVTTYQVSKKLEVEEIDIGKLPARIFGFNGESISGYEK